MTIILNHPPNLHVANAKKLKDNICTFIVRNFQVSHPNIIELLEVFDFSSETCLVTEYISGGDLFDAVSSDTKYSEAVARGMVTDLASALKYLHDNMIVHRDIKPGKLQHFFVFRKY